MKKILKILRQTFSEWNEDSVPRLGAALAYYTVFSLAPLLLIATASAGVFWGYEAVHGHMTHEISNLIGRDSAEALETMIASAYKGDRSFFANIVGFVILFLGATGVFVQLQDALDTVWSVTREGSEGLFQYIRARWLSFAMVLVIGFLLLVSLIFSAMLSLLSVHTGNYFGDQAALLQIVNFLFSFLGIMFLFAMLYKFLPNVVIDWRDTWIGAAFSALLFNVGKYLIGLYLGQAAISSSYGAVGSLVVILLWSYYSAQIFLFGAEFIQVYSKMHGRGLKAKSGFVFIENKK